MERGVVEIVKIVESSIIPFLWFLFWLHTKRNILLGGREKKGWRLPLRFLGPVRGIVVVIFLQIVQYELRLFQTCYQAVRLGR